MAEAGERGAAAASFEALGASAAAVAEDSSPKRAASNTSPLSAGVSLSKISPREEGQSDKDGKAL